MFERIKKLFKRSHKCPVCDVKQKSREKQNKCRHRVRFCKIHRRYVCPLCGAPDRFTKWG